MHKKGRQSSRRRQEAAHRLQRKGRGRRMRGVTWAQAKGRRSTSQCTHITPQVGKGEGFVIYVWGMGKEVEGPMDYVPVTVFMYVICATCKKKRKVVIRIEVLCANPPPDPGNAKLSKDMAGESGKEGDKLPEKTA